MSKHLLARSAALVAITACWVAPVAADQSEDEKAIRAMAQAYVEAFNRKDADAVAAFWSPDAVYSNPITGNEVRGRDAIRTELQQIFADAAPGTLEVTIDSVQFMSPNVAVEQGTARVVRPDEDPDETTYSAVHVKAEGVWLLDRMSEEPIQVVPSNYHQLKDLEWMIGNWVDQDDQATVETVCSWTKNQNFISRTFTVSIGDQIDLSGVQLIGWDPSAQRIRSWVFDSDGGFGEATWTKKDNQWIVNAHSTLPDGRKASAINVMTLVDENTITWEASGRAVDGEILPNIDPIKITRTKEAE